MESAKELSTFVHANIKMDHDPEGKQVKIKYFKSVIGSLHYIIASRFNILFIVGMYARY